MKILKKMIQREKISNRKKAHFKPIQKVKKNKICLYISQSKADLEAVNPKH